MGESYSGETIFLKMKQEILFDEAIARNFVGLVTDQGSNLRSQELGLAGHIQTTFPYAIYVNDLSHLYNLIFKHSFKTFSKDKIEIVDSISSYFSRSPQRKSKLEKIQDQMGYEKLQVIRHVETRWLSFRGTILRILKIWPSLQAYYEKYDKDKKKFFNDENEFYLSVMACLIDKLNYYNVQFQATQKLYDQIFELLQESFLFYIFFL